jgi:hypothetical protein
LTDFELRESRHSGSYNFREGVHKIFLPTYFLLSRPISEKKISTGDLDNILLRYFGFLEHRLREGRTFLVRVNGGGGHIYACTVTHCVILKSKNA